MKSHRQLLAALALAFVSSAAFAQQPPTVVKIGTGECTTGPGASCSTYVEMFRQLKAAVGDVPDLTLQEVQTKGTVDCIDRLIGNELNGCIAQADVLFSRKRNEDLSSIKTLVALHPEEVHYVAKVVTGLKAGGRGVGNFKIGQEDVVFNTIDQLAGYTVGAVQGSGSAATAKLIKDEADIKYTLDQTFKTSDALKAALAAGTVQAAVFVGGANLPIVQSFSADYKLLGFLPATQTTLKDIYKPATLTYTNVNAAGVKTVATQASMVVYEYKGAKMTTALGAFRTAALKAIPDLKETTGTHRKWKQVDPSDHGKWTWYELPTVAAAPAPQAKGAKK
jgi:hypothetical protein